MTKNELSDLYFKWMCQLVCDRRYQNGQSYNRLLSYLDNIEFTYLIGLDGNRAEDGVDLRYRFGYEKSYEEPMIATFLDNRPCSVLEMLIALSIRCEEQIMNDPLVGDRTGKWFWGMIDNLGLSGMIDSNFNEVYVQQCISKFLDRRYEYDGKGGLFSIKHCKNDLRTVEIWYQMCWYLDEVVKSLNRRL